MSGGEHHQLLAVAAALGCSRLDVIERIGEELGIEDPLEALGGIDGVAMSDGRLVIDAEVTAPAPVERLLLQRAARAAADQLVRDDELEEVGRLAILAGDAETMVTAIRLALRTEPPRVAVGVLRRWRDAGVLAAGDLHRGWLDAACSASSGSPLPEVLERYERARQRFVEAGDVEGEISVGMAAAALARRTDDLGTLVQLVMRANELVAAGHDEAIPPAVLGEAFGHQLRGDPAAALAALGRFPSDRLEGDWAAQVLMMSGTNLMLLDRIDDALAALDDATGHGSSWTYAVALELRGTARWNRGDRVGAIDDLRFAEQLGRTIGAAQTAALAGNHLAVLEAADGRTEAETTARRVAARPGAVKSVDDEPARLLAVAAILRHVRAGELDAARAGAAALPLPTRAVRSAHWTVSLKAALIPGTDDELAALADAHPSLHEALLAGRSGAAHLATGSPAPSNARRLLPGAWCEPEPATVELRLLGTPAVLIDGQRTNPPGWERSRVRELALHLALVTSSSRDHIAARLWPDLDRGAANRNLRVTLTYLLDVLDPDRQKGTTSELVDDAAGTLSLRSSPRMRIDVRVSTELAEEIRRAALAGDPNRVVRAARELVRIPGGSLLGGSSVGEWVVEADAARADNVLRAGLAGGPVLVRSGHPDLAEAIAQLGLSEDPWAERLHQVVIRARLAQDDLDGARRALRRAFAALDDLHVRPEPATVELARLVGIDADAPPAA